MKKNQGITLVALVITIIILLILAGITIAQLTESGLFENARLAEEKSKNAQEKENSILADYENKINDYLSNENKITSMKTMLIECGISDDYTMEQLVDDNEDTGEVLTTILNNEKAVDYMLENTNEYIVKLCSTEKGISALSNSNYIQKVLVNDEAYNIIQNQIPEENQSYSVFEENTRIELNLTSNDNVIYSSEQSDEYSAFRAFDGNIATTNYDGVSGKNLIWSSQTSSSKTQEYIGYNFNKSTTLYEIEYWPYYNDPWGSSSNGYRCFTPFYVQGSNGDENNDGEEDWEIINLKESSDVSNNKTISIWGAGTADFSYHKVFFEKPVTYKKYRIVFDDIEYNNDVGGYRAFLTELRMYGK